MNPQDLFYDDWRDALRYTVKALGGYDAVGVELWPGKVRKAAGAWLSDCLNPERPAKLDLEEIEHIVRLARVAGLHVAMYQFADATGYARPEIVTPKSKAQILAEKLQHAISEVTRLADEHAAAEKAESSAFVRSVK